MENKKLKFDEKRLFNFIKEQAKIIKEQSFDVTQINRTANNYLTLLYTWERYNKKIKDLNLLYEAFFELFISLEISYSNYRAYKMKHNIWAKIFGFGISKIKKIDLTKIFKS